MLLPQAIDQIEMMSRDDRLRGMLLSSRLILEKMELFLSIWKRTDDKRKDTIKTKAKLLPRNSL